MSVLSEAPVVVRRHHEVEVMGTVVTIDCWLESGVDTAWLDERLAAAEARLRDADRTFSLYRPDSAVNRLRRGRARLDGAPDALHEVLLGCAKARAESGGWFDAWRMPGGLDPSGYVKGWAAQRALRELTSLPLVGAIVNAAGDVATVGTQGGGAPFRIGIVDPSDPRRLAHVALVDGGLATSGCYERGEHLVNPWTGERRTAVASASVTGPDLGLADALATALCVGGEPVLARLEAHPRYEGLTIGHDGVTRRTSGFVLAAASPR